MKPTPLFTLFSITLLVVITSCNVTREGIETETLSEAMIHMNSGQLPLPEVMAMTGMISPTHPPLNGHLPIVKL